MFDCIWFTHAADELASITLLHGKWKWQFELWKCTSWCEHRKSESGKGDIDNEVGGNIEGGRGGDSYEKGGVGGAKLARQS